MRVLESPARDLLRLVVYYPGQAVVRLLPTPLAILCFETMGALHAALRPGSIARIGAAIAKTGLAAAPRGEAVAHVKNHYVDRLHVFLYPRLAGHVERTAWIRVEGREHLDRALAEGRGAVVVHPHYAVPQLLPLAFGNHGYRCLQIGLPSSEGLSAVGISVAFRTRQRLEKLLPARILPADGYLRPAFRWLAGGGVVFTTGDGTGGGRFRGRFLPIELFGQAVLFPAGAAKLALAARAPLLPAIVLREGRGRYVARIAPPLVSGAAPAEARPAGASAEDGVDDARSDAMMRAFVAWLEVEMRAAPGLWHFWDELGSGALAPGRAA
ncbi:MAG: lauroyl acyltransferase [Acidobacteriota bacterium]